ncbi:hypothetical protein [Sciscionella marina]|uniref:hypothetical protein n=1 Tax=Sciscionella marina TaxID=508770 RepID=UPI000362254F|nr:hypothetical protein [Sciscionella marina]
MVYAEELVIPSKDARDLQLNAEGQWESTKVLASDDDGGLSDLLRAEGWREFTTLGDPESTLFLETWQRARDNEPTEYLLIVNTESRVSPLMRVGSFPEMMELMARWAPAFQATAITDVVAGLTDLQLDPFSLVENVAAKAAYGAQDGLSMKRTDEERERRARRR